MKLATILIVGASLVAAGTATASPRISDLDYLRASRCKGLAETLGGDTVGVDAILKGSRLSRPAVIVDRGEQELARAKREAKGERKDKLNAELSGGCAAYMGGPEEFAATKSPSKAQ